MSKELAIQKEVSPLVQKAQALKIAADTMPEATTMLSMLNKKLDQVTEEKETITKPAKEIIKRENERWDPIVSSLKEAILTLRANLGSYQTKQAQIEADKKAKIADKVAAGELDIDKASTKLSNLKTVPKTTTTEAGAIQFRAVQKLKIINESLIPREYLNPDESRILKDLKAGAIIKGCELVVEQVPYNSR